MGCGPKGLSIRTYCRRAVTFTVFGCFPPPMEHPWPGLPIAPVSLGIAGLIPARFPAAGWPDSVRTQRDFTSRMAHPGSRPPAPGTPTDRQRFLLRPAGGCLAETPSLVRLACLSQGRSEGRVGPAGAGTPGGCVCVGAERCSADNNGRSVSGRETRRAASAGRVPPVAMARCLQPSTLNRNTGDEGHACRRMRMV